MLIEKDSKVGIGGAVIGGESDSAAELIFGGGRGSYLLVKNAEVEDGWNIIGIEVDGLAVSLIGLGVFFPDERKCLRGWRALADSEAGAGVRCDRLLQPELDRLFGEENGRGCRREWGC